MSRRDFSGYLSLDRDQLLKELGDVSSELAGLHIEMSTVFESEKRSKSDGYRYSEESTHAARERNANDNALESTCEVIRLRGEISAVIEERDFIRILLG